MSARKAVPWAAVGFLAGAALGFAWGKTAKSRIGQAVTTEWHGGTLSVNVDTVTAARSGLGDALNSYIDRARG